LAKTWLLWIAIDAWVANRNDCHVLDRSVGRPGGENLEHAQEFPFGLEGTAMIDVGVQPTSLAMSAAIDLSRSRMAAGASTGPSSSAIPAS